MSTPNIKLGAPAIEPASESTMPESLGWQLRAALPPLRLHSVSLYDLQGEVLWLSEGALGPDEHGFVVEALDELEGGSSKIHCESDFHDGRGAVFLAVRATRAELVGLVMILVDGKALAAGGLAARIMTPAVHAILQRLAMWLSPLSRGAPGTRDRPEPAGPAAAVDPLAPAAPPTTLMAPAASTARATSAAPVASTAPAAPTGPVTSTAPPAPMAAAVSTAPAASTGQFAAPALAAATAPASPEESTRLRESPAPAGPATPSPRRADSSGTISLEILAPAEIEEILTFELSPEALPPSPSAPEGSAASIHGAAGANACESAPAASSEPSSAAPAQPPEPASPSELRAQELAKLRPGGRMRRFQIVPRAANESSDAALMLVTALRELLAWLEAHARLTERVPLAFSLAVPTSALQAEPLPGLIAGCLRNAAVRADGIGFEIAESAFVRHRAQAERFVRTVEQLGSYLVVDDFTFDSAALDLLRSKALRLVKVDPRLVVAALRDKLAQARIVAISQAARVLGVHCSAKRVDGEATRRWLAAAGFDFAEGPLFDAPLALALLAAELAQPN